MKIKKAANAVTSYETALTNAWQRISSLINNETYLSNETFEVVICEWRYCFDKTEVFSY